MLQLTHEKIRVSEEILTKTLLKSSFYNASFALPTPNRNGEQMAASWEIYSNLRRSGVLDAPLGI